MLDEVVTCDDYLTCRGYTVYPQSNRLWFELLLIKVVAQYFHTEKPSKVWSLRFLELVQSRILFKHYITQLS